MEGVKTVWRNSASLLFVTGPFRYSRQSSLSMRRLIEAYQRGSQAQPPTTNFLEPTTETREDMEILFVQRHSKSGFMANNHVFPGGVLDKADYAPEWMNVFSQLTGTKAPFSSLISSHKLPLYSNVPHETPIVGEVAFRICAIREMFEEAGVLLVRDKNDVPPLLDLLPGAFSPAVKILPEATRELWRTRVHNDAMEFLTLCNDLGCVPDIWSLMEWSGWLTPRNQRRRYDTVFYTVFSETKPPVTPDGIEVTGSSWMSPSIAEKRHCNGEVVLAPPQFAEIKKLQLFPTCPCLHSFALYNWMNGGSSHRRMSVRILTRNKILVSVSNKDDLYPEQGGEDWKTEIQHPQSTALKGTVELILSQNPFYEYECPKHTEVELLELSQSVSRMELHSSVDCRAFDDSAHVTDIADHVNRYQSLYSSKL